jgi:hypothetical protein
VFETLIHAWERSDCDLERLEPLRVVFLVIAAFTALSVAFLIAGVAINPRQGVPWYVWLIAAGVALQVDAWRSDRDRERLEPPRFVYLVIAAFSAPAVAFLIAGVAINPRHAAPWYVWLIAAGVALQVVPLFRRWLR